jgi:hypothetical protein
MVRELHQWRDPTGRSYAVPMPLREWIADETRNLFGTLLG